MNLDLLTREGPRPVDKTEEALRRILAEGVMKVVDGSYRAHPMRNRTIAEDGRRARICVEWFNKLVVEHRWTADRALSTIRIALDDTLHGCQFRVPTRNFWVPDKGLIGHG